MARQYDDKDIDTKFRQLIQEEFGVETVTRSGLEPKTDSTVDPYEPFSLDRALEKATPEKNWARYKPDLANQPAGKKLGPRLTLGWIIFLVGLMISLVGVFGVWLPAVVRVVGLSAVITGLTILIFSIPRSRDDAWSDGSQV